MSQHYSNQEREDDPYALPDIEVFQLTAREAAEQDEELVFEYSRRHEFRLADMNGKIREAMFDAMIEEEAIRGGWFYWHCIPGCLPDTSAIGPYSSRKDAIRAAQDSAAEWS